MRCTPMRDAAVGAGKSKCVEGNVEMGISMKEERKGEMEGKKEERRDGG